MTYYISTKSNLFRGIKAVFYLTVFEGDLHSWKNSLSWTVKIKVLEEVIIRIAVIHIINFSLNLVNHIKLGMLLLDSQMVCLL